MVGLSPAELESLNELISIDHVYVKPQPVSLQKGREGQHKSASLPRSCGSSGFVTPLHKYSISIPGSKRRYTCQVIRDPVSQTQPNVPPQKTTDNAELDKIDFSLSPSSSLPQPQQEFNVPGVADDFIGLLSDSDMETSLNLFQDFDFSLAAPDIASDSMHSDSIDSNQNIKQDINSLGESLESDSSNSIKQFDEIYQHYLSIKDSSFSCSPVSATVSDSGVSSDFDAHSPHSSVESLYDDMWQDTSFTDLFPDLQ